MLESRNGTDLLRYPRSVKLHFSLLVDQDVTTANLRLQPLDLLAQLPIGVEKVATNRPPTAPGARPAPSRAAARMITHIMAAANAASPITGHAVIAATRSGPRQQRFADENLPGLERSDDSVVDSPPRGQRQSIQGNGLECSNSAALFHPMRLAVCALQQVRARSLDPSRIDRRHHSRVEPRRLQ